MSSAALRIDDSLPGSVPAGGGSSGLSDLQLDPALSEQAIDQVQRELDSLKAELVQVRRQDDWLHHNMRRLDEELRLAGRVQQDFLPKQLPQIGPVRFHTLYRPAGHVSGDLYDVMRLDEAHVGFYMADAVGHGMPAALLTMFLKQALVTKEIDASGYRLLAPEQSMARLNEAMVRQNLSHATFATALYGHLHTRTLRLTFAKGGHPSPILLSAGGQLQPLEGDGPLLGIFPDEVFTPSAVQLSPGDRVFVYSDGVELAFSEHDSPDSEHWQHELNIRKSLPTEQILHEFAQHLDDLPESANRDDLTMIVIEVQR
jgi:serine phosphatase RsbU (regulator of sigma subunit)